MRRQGSFSQAAQKKQMRRDKFSGREFRWRKPADTAAA
jgi:hypothetical protein